MSEEKTTVVPTILIPQNEQLDSAKKRLPMKKIVIISLVTTFAIALILTAILVGMFLFTQAQLDIIKFSKQIEENGNQDVVSDPNTNIVQYHVGNSDQDAWIINDFNRDIQVMKIQTETFTNCYVTQLNRSSALTPSEISGPNDYNTNQSVTLKYQYTNTPVTDVSFLSAPAKDLCKGVSVYWLYPLCERNADNQQGRQSQRNRRDISGSIEYIDKYDTTAWFACIWPYCVGN